MTEASQGSWRGGQNQGDWEDDGSLADFRS